MTELGLQERVARLEGRTEDFGDRFDGLDRRIDAFERRVDARFEAFDRRVGARFDAFGRRLDAREDRRFDDPDLDRIERPFDSLDETTSSYFRCLFGLEIATVVSVLGLWIVVLLLR